MSQHSQAVVTDEAAGLSEVATNQPTNHETTVSESSQPIANTNPNQHDDKIEEQSQASSHPPIYSQPQIVVLPQMGSEEIPPPKLDFSAPPPYEVVTKLPSYEEVQREKTLHGEPMPQPHAEVHLPSDVRTPHQPLTILAIDADGVEGDLESRMLGTDFMFLTAFLVAFLFNWIGFLLLMCFCHTIASRYGALAGFGLSLTKWTIIVKQSTDLGSRENAWLWWLIMMIGILICIRAMIQYVNIKRGWQLLSGNVQDRLLFYY